MTATTTGTYHVLLLAATTPPTGRMVLVNGYDGWIETAAGSFAITSQRSAPGVGHVSEIADGDAPFTPNGCPFQAWSVGEALRLERIVLAQAPARRNRARATASNHVTRSVA
jgi:hypothetical protein